MLFSIFILITLAIIIDDTGFDDLTANQAFISRIKLYASIYPTDTLTRCQFNFTKTPMKLLLNL